MKIIVYLVGTVSAIAFSLGWIFALLQLPMAAELASYGAIAFGLIFMPILAYRRYVSPQVLNRPERLQFNFGFLSVLLISLAVLFKQFQLMGSDTLLLTGGLILAFAFLPLLFFNLYNSAAN